jgi:hypothetical protein
MENQLPEVLPKTVKCRLYIQKKSGRQSEMITRELLAFGRLDPETAKRNLGSWKCRVGSVQVKSHPLV